MKLYLSSAGNPKPRLDRLKLHWTQMLLVHQRDITSGNITLEQTKLYLCMKHICTTSRLNKQNSIFA
jgi:hypothetical protein